MRNFDIHRCSCGGQPRLYKGSRPTIERIRRHEEWREYDADGSYVVRHREYQVEVPKDETTHYVKCPKCKTETAKYGTKTRAVTAWNTGENNV